LSFAARHTQTKGAARDFHYPSSEEGRAMRGSGASLHGGLSEDDRPEDGEILLVRDFEPALEGVLEHNPASMAEQRDTSGAATRKKKQKAKNVSDI